MPPPASNRVILYCEFLNQYTNFNLIKIIKIITLILHNLMQINAEVLRNKSRKMMYTPKFSLSNNVADKICINTTIEQSL